MGFKLRYDILIEAYMGYTKAQNKCINIFFKSAPGSVLFSLGSRLIYDPALKVHFCQCNV